MDCGGADISGGRSARDQRAASLTERGKSLPGVDGGDDLEDVPLALRLRRRLHFEKMHRVHLAAVLANAPRPNKGSSVGMAFMAATTARPSDAEPTFSTALR